MLWPMVPDPHYMKMLYRKREEAFLEEANRQRLLTQESPVRQKVVERMLYGVGTLLISMGERLYERYAPVVPHACEAYQAKS